MCNKKMWTKNLFDNVIKSVSYNGHKYKRCKFCKIFFNDTNLKVYCPSCKMSSMCGGCGSDELGEYEICLTCKEKVRDKNFLYEECPGCKKSLGLRKDWKFEENNDI